MYYSEMIKMRLKRLVVLIYEKLINKNMKITWILLIIYISILLLITFGTKVILKIEKIEKPSLLVLFIFGLLWPLIISIYLIVFIYKNIKNLILHI